MKVTGRRSPGPGGSMKIAAADRPDREKSMKVASRRSPGPGGSMKIAAADPSIGRKA